jgi:hypothetical protein
MTMVQDNMLLPREETALVYWEQYLSGAQRTANANLANAADTEAANAASSSPQACLLRRFRRR